MPADKLAAFLEEYGPGGGWCRFFRESAAYIASRMYRNGEGDFLLIDEWRDERSYREFIQRNFIRYQEMSGAREGLHAEELKIGEFSAELPPG